MKKILFLPLIFICITTQVSTMKRAHEETTPSTSATAIETWLPDEAITVIAAHCDLYTRTRLSLASTRYLQHASTKNNPLITHEDGFRIENENKVYYLVYGCLYNLPKLVERTLACFDPKYIIILHEMEILYPNKRTLNEVTYYTKQLTNQPITNLLPYYENIDIDSTKPLINWAIEQEHIPLMHLVLKQKFTVDPEYRETPLQTALYNCFHNGKLTLLKMILDHKNIDVNMMVPNGDGHALHYTIKQANDHRNDKTRLSFCTKIIKLLVSYPNINMNIQQNTNLRLTSTPLARAVSCNLTEIVKILLADPNTDPNIQNRFGKNALHDAVYNGHIQMIQLLLNDKRTNPNIQNHDGNTPLHMAIKANVAEMVQCLLASRHIAITIRNRDGDTAVTLAKEKYDQTRSTLTLLHHNNINEDGLLDDEFMRDFTDIVTICELLKEHQATHACEISDSQ